MHNVGYEDASDASTPKMAVRKSVALNAVVRPMRSEPANERFQNASV